MTVTYTSEVADCKNFGCFWKLLFRWRGSVYKLVWPDLLAYSFFYFLLSAVYRFVLHEEGRRLFEKISLYTQAFTELIPISFVLGFYVSIVVQRWWAQYEVLPWPDSLSLYISTSITSNDNKGRMMRRTIVRYANLAFTLTLIMISPKMKKRFPTLDHLVEAGLLTNNEKKIFDDMSTKTHHPTYWMPFVWAGTVVARARKEGKIRDDFAVKTIIDEINRLRGLCGSLLSYDWISIPLVYTQVVTLAVYSFFLATLMGRQFLDPKMNYENNNTIDIIVPVFTYLQFFFYMGWLKVAESLVNPFGEDDDDFEINWLVDRNVQVSYLIVDEMHNEHPELIQDIYWDEVFPTELPYTVASQEFRREPPHGSTANLEIPAQDQEILPMVEEETREEMLGENGSEGGITFKRIGSNLSILPKRPSILSFLQKSSNSVRKSSYRRSVQRLNSKSSAVTISPGTNRTGSHVYNMSEVSFSGSEEAFADNYPNSSKESLNTELKSSPGRRRRTRTKTEGDDEGIVFGIKSTKGDEPSFDPSDEAGGRDSDTGAFIDPNKRKSGVFRKERSISVDTNQSERSDAGEKVEFKKDSPSGPMKYLRLPFSSSSGVKKQSKKSSLRTSSPKHSQPYFPSSQRKDFQTRKLTPRGQLRRTSSTDADPENGTERSPPVTSSLLYPPEIASKHLKPSDRPINQMSKEKEEQFLSLQSPSDISHKEVPLDIKLSSSAPRHSPVSSEVSTTSDLAPYPSLYPDPSIGKVERDTASTFTPNFMTDSQGYSQHPSTSRGILSKETILHIEPSLSSTPSCQTPILQPSEAGLSSKAGQDDSAKVPSSPDNSSDNETNVNLDETIWL